MIPEYFSVGSLVVGVFENITRNVYKLFFFGGGVLKLSWSEVTLARLSSRTRPQRAPDCRERDAELLPVTAHWSPDGPQGLPD